MPIIDEELWRVKQKLESREMRKKQADALSGLQATIPKFLLK